MNKYRIPTVVYLCISYVSLFTSINQSMHAENKSLVKQE